MTHFDWEAQRKQQSEDWKRSNEAAIKSMKEREKMLFRNALGEIEPIPEREPEPGNKQQVRQIIKEPAPKGETRTYKITIEPLPKSEPEVKWIVTE